MVRSEVIILTGPAGAGKSTTAASFARTFSRAVHLHTDDFWHFIAAGGMAPHRPESDEQNQTVLRAIVAATHAYAEGGFTVVVDGIVGPWMLRHFRQGLPDGAEPGAHYVVLRPDRDVTLARAQERTTGTALIDPGPVGQLWDQFANLGALESHVIDTSAHSPAQTLSAVIEAVASGSYRLNG